MCRIIINSANYLEEFAKLKDGETIGALERLMSQRPEIEDFEKAQLSTSLHPSQPLPSMPQLAPPAPC